MSNLLSVEKLTMKFGGLIAIDDLSFDAKNNQITSIIGPNGAGKTTVFNCLTGFYKPTTGQMYLHQVDNKVSLSCLLYTSPSPRDLAVSRMPSSA